MAKLHLFYPANDLALAYGRPGYTPPRAARGLDVSGRALPLWYGEGGDEALCGGIPQAWYAQMQQLFHLHTKPYAREPRPELQPAPWGWSLASRQIFIDYGYKPEWLPTPQQIEVWRQLSHRRTAAAVAADLKAALPNEPIGIPAVEIADAEAAEKAVSAMGGRAVVKSPWSCSGRGVVNSAIAGVDIALRRAAESIAKQGSVMIEPAYDRLADFALLYECSDGKCAFAGTSAFTTDALGHYTGNMLAPEAERRTQVSSYFNFGTVAETLRQLLERRVAACYVGPLGVDMLVSRNGTLALLEINLRMTMGHVANRIFAQHIDPSARGTFCVAPAGTEGAGHEATFSSGRLVSGTVNLAPDGPFKIEISC